MAVDQVKSKIAQAVQEAILARFDLVDIKVGVVSPLQTRVRVHTENGPRYFLVSLKEEL